MEAAMVRVVVPLEEVVEVAPGNFPSLHYFYVQFTYFATKCYVRENFSNERVKES